MIRSSNWNETEKSTFTKSMTRSQKSLLSSACSNTSLICDVFNSKQNNNKQCPKPNNHNFHNIRSSNQNNKQTDKDQSPTETQSFMRRSMDGNVDRERENNVMGDIRKSILEKNEIERDHLETEMAQHDVEFERSINMGSYSRRQSSVTYDSSTPLLASRRRRSSVGITSANCHTRSGRAARRSGRPRSSSGTCAP